jgi:2,4-dienoyl-CoA reductase
MVKVFPVMKQVLKLDCMKNKTAIITGGATGLGKKMAEHYAANDVNTIICSRNLERLEKTTNEINSKYGDKVKYYQVDVADVNSVNTLFENINKNNDKPDILINNAAGNFISKTEDLSPNAINKIIDIVLKGTINMSMNFSKGLMKDERDGTILSISTLYADTGSGFVVPSAIAKSGINAMTKSLASEWGKYGIRTLAVAPGSIYTEGAFSRLDPTGEFKKRLLSVNPSGRLGEREELANFITFLTSDYCSWVNGQVINFDGGEGNFRAGQMNELSALPDSFWKMIRK